MRHEVGAIMVALLAAVGLPAPLAIADTQPQLTYAGACGRLRIALIEGASGPSVRVERDGLLLGTTRDASFAHLSKRLFFRLRTATALIEFQGRATPTLLDGMLSDDHETSHISVPAEHFGAASCDKRP